MSEVVPRIVAERISFYENHIPPFTTNAVAIGTSAAAVTDLDTKTQAARAAFDDQQQKKAAAEAATITLRDAVEAMSIAGANIISDIHSEARTGGNGVYALAQIPAPATPTARPAPDKPSGLTVTLDETGIINLKWKCNTKGGGAIYQVWRQIGTGAVEYLGGVGAKTFADNTLPAGSSAVMYQIQAARSTAVSPWATFNVKFGVSVAGQMTATVSEGSAPVPPSKIAA